MPPRQEGGGLSQEEIDLIQTTGEAQGMDQAQIDAVIAQAEAASGSGQGDPFFGQIGPDTEVGAGGFGGPQPGQLSTVGEQLRHFYRMNPNYLVELQSVMYAGGFYGDVDIMDVQWGAYDDASFAAWARVVEQAARRYAAGETDDSVLSVLSEAAVAAGIDPNTISHLGTSLTGIGPDDIPLGAQPGQDIRVSLTDPNALRVTIDRVAAATLGRKANADEQRMFLSLFHNLQREGQIAMQGQAPLEFQEIGGGQIGGAQAVGGAAGAGEEFQSIVPGFQEIADRVFPPGPPTAEGARETLEDRRKDRINDLNPFGDRGRARPAGGTSPEEEMLEEQAGRRQAAAEIQEQGGATAPFTVPMAPTQGDSYVEFASPDPTATAEAFLRQQNPAEAGAHDIAIQMANFLDIIGPQINFPRTTY